MSIELISGPFVTAHYVDPVRRGVDVLVTGGEWEATATLRVKNEQRKKWRIGFVQVLQKNDVRATYEQHFVDEVRLDGQEFPILDGPKNSNSRPFYDKGPPNLFDVEMAANAPLGTHQDVTIKLYDRPATPFQWYLHGADDPLQAVRCLFKFSIYVVAHNRTEGAPVGSFLFLHQTNIKLKRAFSFEEAPRPKQDPLHGLNTKVTVEELGIQPVIKNRGTDIKRPADPLLMGIVANQGVGHKDTPRDFTPREKAAVDVDNDDWW